MRRPVYAVVLAAGDATRFGGTKQLAELSGQPMVAHAMKTAANVCGNRIMLVVGRESGSVAAACNGVPGFVVVNDNHSNGIGTSIACAVNRLRSVADAILITLADQPLITADHLQALIDSWQGGGDEIVATGFSDTAGPPALFARDCFADLEQLNGDNGGRNLLSDSRFRLTTVDFEPAAVDIDTPEDLRRI